MHSPHYYIAAALIALICAIGFLATRDKKKLDVVAHTVLIFAAGAVVLSVPAYALEQADRSAHEEAAAVKTHFAEDFGYQLTDYEVREVLRAGRDITLQPETADGTLDLVRFRMIDGEPTPFLPDQDGWTQAEPLSDAAPVTGQ